MIDEKLASKAEVDAALIQQQELRKQKIGDYLAEFTPKAKVIWDSIPTQLRAELLSNAYCGTCKDAVRIVNFKGSVYKGNLYLEGYCANCRDEVARLID